MDLGSESAMWVKSSFCAGDGACVEVAHLEGGQVGVRDSKQGGSGDVLVFTEHEWRDFLGGVRAGEFGAS